MPPDHLASITAINTGAHLRVFQRAPNTQPNEKWDGPESLYEWAEFDYCYEEYRLDLPEEPTPEDRESEDAWLQFLERIASTHSARAPDYLRLLRDYGAKTSRELKADGLRSQSP